MPNHKNPVELIWGAGSFERLAPWINGKSVGVLGTRGSFARGLHERVQTLGKRAEVRALSFYLDVKPNPTIESTLQASQFLGQAHVDVLLAVGGGSTLDTAKAVAAVLGATWTQDSDALSKHLRGGQPLPEDFSSLPILAVPTTAGTGSEVTPFATLWDERDGRKHSLCHDRLYAQAAFLDPELTLSMPEELTLHTGLDAFSHAVESLWNRNSNPVSRAMATQAIQTLLTHLPEVLRNPANLRSRGQVQEASVLAGIAISSTRTALAHSLSYPMTSELDVPHGLACSFTIPELLKINGEAEPDLIQPLLLALGVRTVSEGMKRLERFFAELKVADSLKKHIKNPDALTAIRGTLINAGRADNAFAKMDETAARALLKSSWLQREDQGRAAAPTTPAPIEGLSAIIIAAGLGSRLKHMTEDVPKCLLPVRGRSILDRQLEALRSNGIGPVNLVRGYKKDRFTRTDLTYFDNLEFRENNILLSLMHARQAMSAGFVASYSDITYEKSVVTTLLSTPGDIVVVADTDWRGIYEGRTDHPLSEAEKAVLTPDGRVLQIGKHLPDGPGTAEFIGMFKCTASGARTFQEHFDRARREFEGKPFMKARVFAKSYITDILQYMIEQGVEVRSARIAGGWQEIDTVQDFAKAEQLFGRGADA